MFVDCSARVVQAFDDARVGVRTRPVRRGGLGVRVGPVG